MLGGAPQVEGPVQTKPTRRSLVSTLLAALIVVGLGLAPLALPVQAPASATNAPVIPIHPRIVLTDPTKTTPGMFVQGPDGRLWYSPGSRYTSGTGLDRSVPAE